MNKIKGLSKIEVEKIINNNNINYDVNHKT